MKRIHIYSALLCFALSLQAQNELNERVYIHLDKDCYVAGEEMQVKFYVIDTEYHPSDFSKVGYVEVCDTEKPHVQMKIALKEGTGAGKVAIPLDTPSGVYELSGYTRYMRNEGEATFFKRQLAIVNMAMGSESDRIELVASDEKFSEAKPEPSTIKIATDNATYESRSKVNLSLNNLPQNITDLVVTVYRNDSATYIPQVDKSNWSRQVASKKPIVMPWKWLPEYEGHIITGRLENEDGTAFTPATKGYTANIGFVGKDVRYIQGQQRDDQSFNFYTGDIYGPQEIVTSVIADGASICRMGLVSPFSETLPSTLPPLRISAEDKKLMDRFVGVQLKQVMGVDSLGSGIPLESYYHFRNPKVYDLDEYTRFPTLGETIIEFVNHVVVRKGKLDRRVMKALILDENRFSSGNTLVLLDGVAIHNHEEMLKYNPLNIRTINIYDGRYLFGGELYECLISFVSHRRNLSAIQLDEYSQLLAYDCPLLPDTDSVEYPDEKAGKSLKPDFRHTLYWNPFAESIVNGSSAEMSFYTSDLSGEYKVVVEGFTKTGNNIYGTAFFNVSP